MSEPEKPWNELTDDELIQALFPKEVIEKVREVTRKQDDLEDSEELLDES